MNLLTAIISGVPTFINITYIGTGEILSTSAGLEAVIQPLTTSSTSVRFEYSTSSNLFNSTLATATESPLSPNGTSAYAVSKTITGLSSGTTYYFRVQAQNNDTAPDWISSEISSFITA